MLHTDTPTLTPTYSHTLTVTHTHKHVCDQNKHTHNTAPHPPQTYTQTAEERAASHLSPMQSCLPLVLISESQVKAAWKRCILRLDLKNVIDVGKWTCIETEFHTQLTRHLILERCLIHIYWNPNGHNAATWMMGNSIYIYKTIERGCIYIIYIHTHTSLTLLHLVTLLIQSDDHHENSVIKNNKENKNKQQQK